MNKLSSWLSPGLVALLLSPFAAIGFLLKLFADAFEYENGLIEADFYLHLIAVVVYFTLALVSFGGAIHAVNQLTRQEWQTKCCISWLSELVFVVMAVAMGVFLVSKGVDVAGSGASLIRPLLDAASQDHP